VTRRQPTIEVSKDVAELGDPAPQWDRRHEGEIDLKTQAWREEHTRGSSICATI